MEVKITNNIKLSFILPFYNVEKYIAACLDSLFTQDIPQDEYEIICVNDCSPDDSRNIVVEYQKNHANLILIDHEENKCLGGARNTGISEARGEYLWFIDSDDMICPNCVKGLVDICRQNRLDLLMFNFDKIDINNNNIEEANLFSDSEIMNGQQYIQHFFKNSFANHLGYVWRQIYKTEYLKYENIRFPEQVFWEDTVFMPKALLFAKRVLSIKESFYQYRINPNSVSGLYDSKLRAELIYQFAFNAGKDLMDLSKEIKEKDNEISCLLFEKSVWYINSFIFRLLKAPILEKKRFFNLLKSNQEINYQLTFYMTRLNKFLCKNPKFGLLCVLVITPAYKIKQQIKKSLKR